MERNVDKIKRLEKEIGRYQKKVADQAKEKERLRRLLEIAEAGAIQTHQAVDAILAQTAITFGEVVKDEETGAELGHRLTVPAFKVGEILGKYQVRTRRDEETGAYIIGVVPKEEEPDEEEKEDTLTAMTYSKSRNLSAFLSKVSASAESVTGTSIDQLEKRLALLKY